ncbi:ribosome maturation factor RimM [Amorphus sp. 3PC139-8]|uniref:ribosome maturation factor RimM n=1 Tax=Amorphus sp. 3PC139-8 TaxID=2735676 RepID=UPI00345DA56E
MSKRPSRPRTQSKARPRERKGPAVDPSTYVALAEIGAPHGIRGSARIRLFGEDPALLLERGPLLLGDGRELRLVALEPQGSRMTARFEGVPDRTAVEALRGERLWLPRSALPELEDEDTFYHVDLIGLAVVDTDGEAIGRVRTIQDFGAGDLIEVERADKPSVFVPFTLACVPTVDLKAGRLVVEPPVGLLEDAPPEDEADGEGDHS